MIRENLAVTIIFILILNCSISVAQSDCTYINKITNLYHQKNHYDSAAIKLLELAETSGENLLPLIYHLIGTSHWENYDIKNAEKYFKKSSEFSSTNNKIHLKNQLGLAQIFIRKRELMKAKEIIKYIDLVPNKGLLEEIAPALLVTKFKLSSFYNIKDIDSLFFEYSLRIKSNNIEKINLYLWYIDHLTNYERFVKAREYYVECKSLIEKHFDQNVLLNLRLYLQRSYLEFGSGDLNKAINIVENNLLPILSDKKLNWAKHLLADTYRLAAWYVKSNGDYLKAIEYNLNYIELSDSIYEKDHFRNGKIYFELASLFKIIGNYELAKEYQKQSILIYENQKNHRDLINSMYERVRLEFDSRNYKKSLELVEELLKQSNLDDYTKFRSLHLKARIHYWIEEFDAMLSAVIKAETIVNKLYKNKNIPIFRQLNKLRLVAIYKSKRWNFAFEEYKEYLKNFDKQTEIIQVSKLAAYLDFIQFQIEENQIDSAFQNLNDLTVVVNHLKTYSATKIYNFDYTDYRIAQLRGDYYNKKSVISNNLTDLINASVNYKLSMKYNAEENKEFKSDRDKIDLLKKRNKLLEKTISCTHRLYKLTDSIHYADELFELFEMSKSNQLLESLNRNTAIKSAGIPDTLVNKINNLKQQASFLGTQITRLSGKSKLSDIDSTRLVDYKFSMTENKRTYTSTMHYLEGNFPNYYNLNYGQSFILLSEVQNNLNVDEALLEYYVGQNDTYSFTITRDSFYVNKLDKIPIIDVLSLSKALEYSSSESIGLDDPLEIKSHKIYDELVSNAIRPISKSINKIYVIPDKYLNHISFEALITEPLENKTDELIYNQLNYLIKKYTISYGFSASVLFKNNQQYSHNSKDILAFAPSYKELLRDTSQLAKLGALRNDLVELIYNKTEVKNIGNFFNVESYKNENATERSFSERVNNHDIIHLAMHAVVDNEDPMNSKLIFSPVSDQNDSVYDNYLHNFEIYNMNLNAKLAVLSACNTGYGKIEGGEGMMSMGRAFTYAGVESVVTSHWRADDKSTSELMTSFYKYLAKGQDKAEALRNAKLEFLETTNFQKHHPFFWAGFVLTGDTRPVKTSSNFFFYLYLIGGLSFLIFASFLIKKKISL